MSNLWIICLRCLVFSFVTRIVLPLSDLFLPYFLGFCLTNLVYIRAPLASLYTALYLYILLHFFDLPSVPCSIELSYSMCLTIDLVFTRIIV